MGWDEDIAIEKGMQVDHHNAMIAERDAEIARLKADLSEVRVTNAKNSEDASILLAIVQHFYTDGVDRGDHQPFVDAVQFAIDDTGIPTLDMLDHIARLGFTVDEDVFERDWNVTIVVPVTVCLTVQATNPQDAGDLAMEEVDSYGIDKYHMDYNMHYDGEVTDVEETY
jgi:6-phosphofructokinase